MIRVTLLVQREAGTTDCCWVIDAVDEYTIDEWNGVLPDQMKEKIAADPDNIRELIVEIPDDALTRPFLTPTVRGTVAANESFSAAPDAHLSRNVTAPKGDSCG